MVLHILMAAVAWWSATPSGFAAAPLSHMAPQPSMTVPRGDWAYQALSDLAAAGWEIKPALQPSQELTRADFAAAVVQLVAAAATREQTGKTVPMAQRVLLVRLVAEFSPAAPQADAVRVPGLYPEVASSPDATWLALFVPTPSGAEILVVDRTTLKTARIASEGYNYGPTWSEHGDEVAWLRYAEGRTEVWVHGMITGDEHLVGSALSDAWGKLIPAKDGYTLLLPGRPLDRLIHIPPHVHGDAAPGGEHMAAP